MAQKEPGGPGTGRAWLWGGATLPRTPFGPCWTPFGPCRSSGCTAAAGPLDCSPSYRAPGRQKKVFGTAPRPVPSANGAIGGGEQSRQGSWFWPVPVQAPNPPCSQGPVLTWSCWCIEDALSTRGSPQVRVATGRPPSAPSSQILDVWSTGSGFPVPLAPGMNPNPPTLICPLCSTRFMVLPGLRADCQAGSGQVYGPQVQKGPCSAS